MNFAEAIVYEKTIVSAVSATSAEFTWPAEMIFLGGLKISWTDKHTHTHAYLLSAPPGSYPKILGIFRCDDLGKIFKNSMENLSFQLDS